jgi:hypothetical protein
MEYRTDTRMGNTLQDRANGDHSARFKALEGITHPFEALGLHPTDALARTH